MSHQTFDNELLQGLRLVEGPAFVSAPLAGAVLGSLGADAIRVDPISGPIDGDRWPLDAHGHSLYWVGLNEGKRSVAIDLRWSAGQDLVLELATAAGDGAGIVLTSNPGVPWFDYQRLRARRSDVILCEIVGHPDGSPAVDYTVTAAVGSRDHRTRGVRCSDQKRLPLVRCSGGATNGCCVAGCRTPTQQNRARCSGVEDRCSSHRSGGSTRHHRSCHLVVPSELE